jgi:hypothetical protein
MAPEIAFGALAGLAKKSIVLDPMVGSGTVMRTISELGYQGIGFDVDPLSVLMSKAWTSKVDKTIFFKRSGNILAAAEKLSSKTAYLPWIDEDIDTKNFINFWFAPSQIADLRKLSYVINNYKREYAALYKVAFSRLIITKSKGASLAADVSHSRPHKVRDTNEFDVFVEFQKSCSRISEIINSEKLLGTIKVHKGDARRLKSVKNNSIDSIITSPPYLNALDYMRGHKLSLVWLGHKIGDLASIRSGSVGAEKAPDKFSNMVQAKYIIRRIQNFENLPLKIKNMVYRYALDMESIVMESARVLRKNRNATFVIGNSSLKGVYIDNTVIAEEAALKHGLRLVDSKAREIPQNKRYLPPPTNAGNTGLNARMRTETIMTFKKVK